jgi:two-component system CheB/CheR fusion protein
LFLGPAETIGRSIDLFEPISTKWRIYRRIGPSHASNFHFPAMQLEPLQAKPQPAAGRSQAPPKLAELAQNFLLRRFALACVVINRNYEVLHFAGPTEDYLVQLGGPPTQDLVSLARPGLESKLRVVIQRTIRQNAPQSVTDVMMRHGGVSRRVNINVEPLNLPGQPAGLLLVAFHEQPSPVGEALADARTRAQTADSDLVRQLEQELQSTIEELESSNEELKASNEEIMSMNEELQSANEELETSKEELQSLNEELNTVNNHAGEGPESGNGQQRHANAQPHRHCHRFRHHSHHTFTHRLRNCLTHPTDPPAPAISQAVHRRPGGDAQQLLAT